MAIHRSLFGNRQISQDSGIPRSPRHRPDGVRVVRRPQADATGDTVVKSFETTGHVALRVALAAAARSRVETAETTGSRSTSSRCATTTSRGRRSRRPASR